MKEGRVFEYTMEHIPVFRSLFEILSGVLHELVMIHIKPPKPIDAEIQDESDESDKSDNSDNSNSDSENESNESDDKSEKMFGMSKEELNKMIDDSRNKKILAMGILSDIQEVILVVVL